MDSAVTSIYFNQNKQELWAKVVGKGLDIIHFKSGTITHLNKDNYLN